MKEITSGLGFPEGPIAMPDGSVILVEIRRGTLTRVRPDGTQEIIAETGGGPNGAAIGPDGHVYVCNNGGFVWHDVAGLTLPGQQPDDYSGGSIQRVNIDTGAVETLYSECDGIPLRGPNDIVFDRHGGFWFTDHGKIRDRERDRTGFFYATPDGKSIREVVFPLEAPNGIGLSPEGDRVYVAETPTARVYYWEVAGPGEIKPQLSPNQGYLLAGLGGMQMFDSLAVDAQGNVCVATLVNGGISIISPDGTSVRHVAMPDPLTTNICFGGEDMRTAYITLSGTGKLVSTRWETPGLKLEF
ncbi:MAG: SMP-30/gluconolactonase/LRE family protein [bacterium]|nr:SMP-30/gluconolactonase/LRE family protein [bacterium]